MGQFFIENSAAGFSFRCIPLPRTATFDREPLTMRDRENDRRASPLAAVDRGMAAMRLGHGLDDARKAGSARRLVFHADEATKPIQKSSATFA